MTELEFPKEVPQVVFKTRVRDESVGGENPFRWQDVTSDEIFKGRKVVLFSLPGAFTPTCSSTHLPGSEAKFEEFKALGVDEIICLSVNDAFVMYQWGKATRRQRCPPPDGIRELSKENRHARKEGPT